jgi:xylan 1,4-beta-xylosidase
MSCEANAKMDVTYPIQHARIQLPDNGSVWLRANVNHRDLEFSWSLDGEHWTKIPVMLDMGLLSDEAGEGIHDQFTGAFVGLCCNDISGNRKPADFAFFSYYGADS